MVKIALLVVSLLALGIVLPLASAANVDVTITVIDKYGDQITDANVNLSNSTDVVCSGTTNSNGQIDCSMEAGAGKDYQITVTHDNYKPIDDNQTLKNFDNDWRDIGIVMRPTEFNLSITVMRLNEECQMVMGNTTVEGANVTVKSLDEDWFATDYAYYDKVVFPDEKDHYEAFVVAEDQADKVTDEDGKVIVEGLEYNTRYMITPAKTGYGVDTPTGRGYFNFDYAKDAETTVDLIAQGTVTYKAIVTDEQTGDFIMGANVTVTSQGMGESWTHQTNLVGKATFALTTPGWYNVSISKEGFCWGSIDYSAAFPGHLSIAHCEKRHDQLLELMCAQGSPYDEFGLEKMPENPEEGNASLTVVVRDQDTNELIQGAEIVVANTEPGGLVQDDTTDSNGEASFTVDAPASYLITASKKGYYPFGAGEEPIDVENGDSITFPIHLTPQNESPPTNWNNTISLVAGVWKLVSVPYELVNNSVDAVFPLKAPIGTGDNWVLRYNSTGWENPSMTIDSLKGYWVKSDTNTTVNLQYKTKSPDDLFPEIELKQGWNMIGHTEDKAQPIEAALYSLYDNGQPTFEIVYRWDGSNWEKYIPGVLAEFNYMSPGEGYWIKMKEDWNYTAIDMNTVA